MKASAVLGLNARSQLFSYPYNRKEGKRVANSKILTAKRLKKLGIPTPKIYKKFVRPHDIIDFDWESLPAAFALKPNRGLGGEGIIVVKKRSNPPSHKASAGQGMAWIDVNKKRIEIPDLKLHVVDILEGAFNRHSVSDIAFIQEYVGRHKAFRKYAYRGTPDIRIIVFNYVPVMAMLRLPTQESAGRANLHQGAIAVGIDIGTGITTRAVWHQQPIRYKPGTKRKLHGIRIPHWKEILEVATRCQDVRGLGYMGVDVVLHPEKGPMVLELNNQPGLQIQLANHAGLKKRLERVEDLEVGSPEKGVKIAKALFSASFADRVKVSEGVKTVGVIENIKVRGKKKKRQEVRAKIDSGAWRTSIDHTLAEELGLLTPENILWEKSFRSALGKQKRTVIGLTYFIKGRGVETVASVTSRKNLRFKVIIGRKDLVGFLINPMLKKKENK